MGDEEYSIDLETGDPVTEGRSGMVLELATEADIADIVALEKKVTSRTYIPLGDENQLSKMIAKGSIYKIKKGEELAGIVAYYKEEDGSVYIDALATDPKFRGQHLGREALVKILEELRDVPKIWLVTHPENPAVKLYESLGFKITERKENYFGDGEPRVVLVLTRPKSE